MIIEIIKTSTLEANVSKRTIKFAVFAKGYFITDFDEFDEAEEFKESLESGDMTIGWSKVSR